MFERILVCLDGSKLSEQILPYAEAEALGCGGKLMLLQVYSIPAATYAAATPATASEVIADEIRRVEAEAKAAAKAYLESIAQPLRAKGIEVDCADPPTGHIGQAIVDYADKNEIGLIALATHGRSGLGRLVFGSVADFVLRESGLPILLIKPKEIEKKS